MSWLSSRLPLGLPHRVSDQNQPPGGQTCRTKPTGGSVTVLQVFPPGESEHCVTHRQQMWSGPRSLWRWFRPAASLCGPRWTRRLRTEPDPRRRWAGSSSSSWTSGRGPIDPHLLDLEEPPVLLTLCRRRCAKAKANVNTRPGQERLVTSDKDEQVRVAPVWKLSAGGSWRTETSAGLYFSSLTCCLVRGQLQEYFRILNLAFPVIYFQNKSSAVVEKRCIDVTLWTCRDEQQSGSVTIFR